MSKRDQFDDVLMSRRIFCRGESKDGQNTEAGGHAWDRLDESRFTARSALTGAQGPLPDAGHVVQSVLIAVLPASRILAIFGCTPPGFSMTTINESKQHLRFVCQASEKKT
ncbi:hypothetical protein K438DRAFT_1774971 [Mycena galopus ATCC 62051]|nr:hypothetical protein K438DRAFT_1774971 [Mycena galopus ATCC 62051]